MKFRPYQWQAIRSVWQYFNDGNNGNPLIAMPCGTGKSLVIGGFVRTVLENYPYQKIIVATHIKELISQNYRKLLEIWPGAPAGIFSAGLNRADRHNNIIFAGIGSIAKRPAEFGKIDLLIVDEAHLISPTKTTLYQKLISGLKTINPNLKVIGLTATPFRLTHGVLTDGNIFDDMCFDNTRLDEFNILIDDGYLCPLVPKKTDLIYNTDDVRIQGGEFVLHDLQNSVDKYELTDNAIKETILYGQDRKHWLVFTAGIDHAIHTKEILNYHGVPAKVVHSNSKDHKMSDSERDEAIDDFKQGKITALVNANILTTGFDYPDIDLLACLRPTTSPGLWVQQLGRGIRPVYAPGFDLATRGGRLAAISAGSKQNCLVLDFGDNTRRLGPINDPVLPTRRNKRNGKAPVKLCKGMTADNKHCDTWLHASTRICPYCGEEFKFDTKLLETASNEELIRKNEDPVIKEYDVDTITYLKHNKRNGLPSLQVYYYCGLRRFQEYICFEHEGYPRFKAKEWWYKRILHIRAPETIDDALQNIKNLREPKKITVWINKKHPEILDYKFG